MAKETCRSLSGMEQLETVFDTMFDAVFILDVSMGEIVYANQAMCAMYGYSPSEVLQLTIQKLSAGEPNESAMDSLSMAIQGSAHLLNWKARKKGGTLFWAETSLQKAGVAGKDLVIAVVRDITERKRIEEELEHVRNEFERRVEERTAELAETVQALLLSQFCIEKAAIGIYHTTLEGNILSANDFACRSLGYTADELCALKVSDIDPAITSEKALEIKRMLDDTGSATHETIHRRKDGSTFPVEITANNLEFQGKSYTFSFVKDITERKKMEEELLLSHFCIDKAAIGIFQISLDDGEILRANDSASRSLGYSSDELRTMSVLEIDPSLTREKFVEIKRVLEPSGSATFETVHRRKNGTTFPVEITASNLEFQGKSTGFVFFRDITEQKRAITDLQLTQFFVDKASIGIHRISEEGNILFVNEVTCRSLGYTAEELCSMTIFDIDPTYNFDKFREHRRSVRATGSRTFETIHRRKDGSTLPVEVTVSHLEYQDKEICFSFVKDITGRKLAEEELKRQKQLLQELNETLENRVVEEVAKNREKDIMLIQQNRQAALGEMLDHIAHQWKQPLNSIALIIQYLREAASDGELTDELIEVTVSKTMALLEHMAQTIDVFRDFYRPDKEKKVFSVKDSINQALAFIAPAFKFQSIAAELDVNPELTAFGYPKEFAQVLLNILANARNVFMARGTKKPRVILKAFAKDNKTFVTIIDNAGGIPETIKDKIFDFYFTTNESSGGTGIGLYMSKNIIEKNMRGTLSAENTDGGAQFRIEIPTT